MKKTLFFMACTLVAILSLSSCKTREKIVYLQDMSDTEEYPVIQKYEAVIKRDDKLSISVSCKNPELALAFNIPGTGGYTISADGSITASQQPNVDSKNKPGYTVDVNGDIDFPILGKLHVEGLTKNQLINLITTRLKEEELLKDPIVLVEFLNFKITVLGEVGGVGVYEFNGDRVTILDAIAKAGNLTDNARIDHVAVIREYGNKRRVIWNDLRTKDVFLSPAFYLQQNDIIYAEPNDRKIREDTQRNISQWQTWVYSISSLVSLIMVFTKL